MWTLTAALIVASLGIGVAMTAAYSVAGALLPADAHVTGFGIMTTASLVGLAFSPVLAGFVGASGLRVVFRRRRRCCWSALAVAVAARMRPARVRRDGPTLPRRATDATSDQVQELASVGTVQHRLTQTMMRFRTA